MQEKIFRDPVHGDISLRKDLEVSLMDTPEFQRMRGIKQLGTACLVYPSATHTRFEHSLGTCHLAGRMVEHIEKVPGSPFEASDDEKKQLYAAALLHDISHIPFGHTFEDERRIFPRHDSMERLVRFLHRGKLGTRLKELGLTEAVADIVAGQPARPVFRDIVSGTICADLLDYLARDAYFCGLRVAYDPRIFRFFRVTKRASGQGDLDDRLYIEAQKDGIIREDVLSEVINLLRIRYFLSERIYFHHSKTASGAMISRAVECAVNRGLALEDMFDFTDDHLLMRLGDMAGRGGAMGTLLEHYLSHRLYKRAYVLTLRREPRHNDLLLSETRQKELIDAYHHDRHNREETEHKLIKKLRLKEGELIIYCPSARMSLKEADVLIKVDSNDPRRLADLQVPEIQALQEKHRDLWRFYVFVAPRHAARFPDIGRTCEAMFGNENHLPALESGQGYLGI